jgi:hypothetical protein
MQGGRREQHYTGYGRWTVRDGEGQNEDWTLVSDSESGSAFSGPKPKTSAGGVGLPSRRDAGTRETTARPSSGKQMRPTADDEEDEDPSYVKPMAQIGAEAREARLAALTARARAREAEAKVVADAREGSSGDGAGIIRQPKTREEVNTTQSPPSSAVAAASTPDPASKSGDESIKLSEDEDEDSDFAEFKTIDQLRAETAARKVLSQRAKSSAPAAGPDPVEKIREYDEAFERSGTIAQLVAEGKVRRERKEAEAKVKAVAESGEKEKETAVKSQTVTPTPTPSTTSSSSATSPQPSVPSKEDPASDPAPAPKSEPEGKTKETDQDFSDFKSVAQLKAEGAELRRRRMQIFKDREAKLAARRASRERKRKEKREAQKRCLPWNLTWWKVVKIVVGLIILLMLLAVLAFGWMVWYMTTRTSGIGIMGIRIFEGWIRGK